MKNFLKADSKVRSMLLSQAGEKIGLSAKSVEKDLWVTQVLHALFSIDISDRLIFKGGTSLSKAWGLIDRFSEDIDLAIDPMFLGAPDVRERMALIPRADIMENWRRDYENMRDAMIYGEKPTWEQLMDAMERLQKRVRSL